MLRHRGNLNYAQSPLAPALSREEGSTKPQLLHLDVRIGLRLSIRPNLSNLSTQV
jgi:hypothetical protein